jgi:hypothetical protein
MSIRQRVWCVWLASLAAIPGAYLLAQELSLGDGWRFAAWVGLYFGCVAVLDRFARCPNCGVRLLESGFKPDVGKFAYIRCQGCRRRFDGREGPDPEVSDEALAQGDPILLEAYRETSAEMDRLTRARKDPVAREALLADLEGEAQQCEAELLRRQALRSREPEMTEFLHHRLERIRQEIIELRQQT